MDDGTTETITIQYEPDRFTWGLSQQLNQTDADTGENAVSILTNLLASWDLDDPLTEASVRALGLPIQTIIVRAIEADAERFRMGDASGKKSGGN